MNEKINELYFIQSSPHHYRVYKSSIEKPKKLDNPHDQESVTHSFIKKFNEIQKRQDTYGDFPYPYYPDKLKLFVSDDDHFCIRMNRMMLQTGEAISIQMPVAQFVQCVGNTLEFETWYRNKLLKLKIGHSPFILYDPRDECLRIELPRSNPYNEDKANMTPLSPSPMMSVLFTSKRR